MTSHLKTRWAAASTFRIIGSKSASVADATLDEAIDLAIHAIHLTVSNIVDRREVVPRLSENLFLELTPRRDLDFA